MEEVEKQTINSNFKDIKNTILQSTQKEMSTSDYMVAFSGLAKSYCVGLVDMANSTKISANMNEREWCRYYEIFLNSMATIFQSLGAL